MNKNISDSIDSIDRSLIEILQKDGRLTSDELAKLLNVSSATIRRRIRTLLRNNVIRIVAITDLKKIGINLMVGIDMEINPKTVDIAAEELASYKAVKSVALTTGRFNCSALVAFTTTDEFQDFMRSVVSNLKGLTTMESHIFIEFKKGRFIHGD